MAETEPLEVHLYWWREVPSANDEVDHNGRPVVYKLAVRTRYLHPHHSMALGDPPPIIGQDEKTGDDIVVGVGVHEIPAHYETVQGHEGRWLRLSGPRVPANAEMATMADWVAFNEPPIEPRRRTIPTPAQLDGLLAAQAAGNPKLTKLLKLLEDD